MLNASAETNSPLAVFGLLQVQFFSAGDIAPLGELVVVEGVAILVGTALVQTVSDRLAGIEAGGGNDIQVVGPG